MFTRTQQQQQQQQQRRRCARPSMQLHVMVGDVSVTLCYFQGTSRVTCEITVSSCAARFEMVTPTDCRLLSSSSSSACVGMAAHLRRLGRVVGASNLHEHPQQRKQQQQHAELDLHLRFARAHEQNQ